MNYFKLLLTMVLTMCLSLLQAQQPWMSDANGKPLKYLLDMGNLDDGAYFLQISSEKREPILQRVIIKKS